MTKLIKFTGRTLGIIIEWLFILVFTFAFLIRTPFVQTYLAHEAADFLSKELNTTIKIDEVAIVFIDRVAIDGFYIEDLAGDTLAYCERLHVNIDDLQFKKQEFYVGEIDAERLFLHIKKDSLGDGNHEFIRDYFVNDKKKTKNPKLHIRKIACGNGRFYFDDVRQKSVEKGMDVFHMRIRDINAQINDLKVVNNIIYGDIVKVEGEEACGFKLKNLTTFATVSRKGAKLKNLFISTKDSRIYASKFNMLSDRYNSFNHFVDSVRFDGQIDSSYVNLKDISHFAYQLEGMNDNVRISVKVSNYTTALELHDLELEYAKKTKLRGDFKLDDYRDLMAGKYHEKIAYAYVDLAELKKLRLPDKAETPYIKLPKQLNEMGFIELRNLSVDGTPGQFDVQAELIHTLQGSVAITAPLRIQPKSENNSIAFKPLNNSLGIQVNHVQLGKLIENKDVGELTGRFAASGVIYQNNKVQIDELRGEVELFEYLNYPYSRIIIQEGSYIDDVFTGKIDVADDNLDLVYDGLIDFKGRRHLEFTIDLTEVFLDRIHVSQRKGKLKSLFRVDLYGKTSNELQGNIHMDGFVYAEGDKEISIPSIDVSISRSASYDRFVVSSDLGTAVIEGKLNLDQVMSTIKYQISRVFPTLVKKEEIRLAGGNKDNFTFDIRLNITDNLFAIFLPEVRVAPETTIKGRYFGVESTFNSDIRSDSIGIRDMRFRDITIQQNMDSTKLSVMYHAATFEYNDSLRFDNLYFKTDGEDSHLLHNLTWDEASKNPSKISWSTQVIDWRAYHFCIDPSYFFIRDHKWEIEHESSVHVFGDTIDVDYFELNRGDQMLSIDGKISNLAKHRLNFKIDNFDIGEIAQFFTSEYQFAGLLNGWGFISTPFDTINFEGDASLLSFKVNDRDVGDIYLQSNWRDETKSVYATGDLIYKGAETFTFSGDYYIKREEDNLDFNLDFEYTDIEVANAFMDPELLDDIRGILQGQIKLTGTPTKPKTEGTLNLYGGSAYVSILGTHFITEGQIEMDEYGFYANNIPVFDEEGNAGSLIGSVYHDNFSDFSFDLQFDLENDAINKDPFQTWKPALLKEFTIMNAKYSPDVLYYGKGIATGYVNIFGYTDNLEITVDLTTRKGTTLKIPMYGMGEISEENDFIVFKQDLENALTDEIEKKFDFTGVYLDLNFHATPEATVQIIFNEDIGDIITANGTGDINISVNNLGEVGMKGTYIVNEGVYDFALGIIRKQFFIEKGGSISWSGDPYEAMLDLKTIYKVNANIADISADQFASGTGAHQPIWCYLNLSESLSKPSIEFDIKAPEANEIAKSLINRVTGDKDELNRQFFSLMLFRKFQPLNTTRYSGNVAAEMITNQINSILSSVSSNYNMGVNYKGDQLSGDKKYEFMVSRSFLNNRLILTGTFGVENYSDEAGTSQADFIGDLTVEYLINESGSFRGKIFNESNDHSIILESDPGRFTQGIGMSYKEDFNTMEDFKLLQYFLDFFRKKENKRIKIKKKSQQRKVPVDGPITFIEPEKTAILPEEPC